MPNIAQLSELRTDFQQRPLVTPAINGHVDLRTPDNLPLVPPMMRVTAGRDHVPQALAQLLASGEPVAVDIETEGLGAAAYKMKSVAVAVKDHAVVCDPRDPEQAHYLRSFFTLASQLVFHNSSFDVPSLGVNKLFDVDNCHKVIDTLIYARMADSDPRHSKKLETLSQEILGYPHKESILTMFRSLGLTKAQGYKQVDLDSWAYLLGNAADALATAQILPELEYRCLDRTVNDHPFSTHGVVGDEAVRLVHREQRVNRMLLPRSVKGLNIDLDFMADFEEKHNHVIDKLEKELKDLGIAPGNGAPLVAYLDKQGFVPDDHPRTKKTKAPSSAKSHLEAIDHPLIAKHIMYKELCKVRDDYLVKIRDVAGYTDGRVHPTVSVLGASATGRSSVSEPPLHQLPDAARGVIRSDTEDGFTSLDWSQIEPILMANMAGDIDILEGYEDGSSDMYMSISDYVKVPRKTAKVVLLAQMYGEGRKKLARDLKMSVDEAAKVQEQVFRPLPRSARFLRTVREVADKHGKIVTLSGRILTVPKVEGWHVGMKNPWGYPAAQFMGYKGVNYTIQGSAYDVLAETLVRIHEAGLSSHVHLLMHDEIVVDTPVAKEVEQIMRQPPQRLCEWSGRTPVLRTDSADMGTNWKSV